MVDEAGTATPAPPRAATKDQRQTIGLLVACVQVPIVMFTWVMGLGWAGSTYVAAQVQSWLAFAAIGILAAFLPRPHWTWLVPLLSMALTFALVMVGGQLGHTGA